MFYRSYRLMYIRATDIVQCSVVVSVFPLDIILYNVVCDLVTWLSCDITYCIDTSLSRTVVGVRRVQRRNPNPLHPKLQRCRRHLESMKLKELHSQAWAKRRMTPTVAPLTRRRSQKQFRNLVSYSCPAFDLRSCVVLVHITLCAHVCAVGICRCVCNKVTLPLKCISVIPEYG